MSKVVACIIARTTSTRLPLKVLRDCGYGYSMLSLLIKRLKSVSVLDDIFICTSDEPVDDILVDVAVQNDVQIYRGSPDKVIERMIAVTELTGADILLRITGDNPLTSVEYIPDQVNWLKERSLEYVRIVDIPIGATAEVMASDALIRCYHSIDPSVSEYLLLYMFDPEKYSCGILKVFDKDYSNFSLTVDTPSDYKRLRITTSAFSNYKNRPQDLRLSSIIEYYIQHPDLPAREIKFKGKVKMPYGKEIEFEKFNDDMKLRAQASEKLKLY